MKPRLLKVPHNAVHSFSVRNDMLPNINNHWHHHEEVELIYFHQGQGTQFVGDGITHFEAGDLVLVGSNLPHYWKYDHTFFEEGDKPCSTVIHFYENFWGDRFLNMPETKAIKQLLEKAKRGILIKGAEAVHIKNLMGKIYDADGLYRIIFLLECLTQINQCPNNTILSSVGFNYNFPEAENERINAIYNYTLFNFQQKVKLEEVAAIAGMTPNSFCRYFKLQTGKTFFEFLTEIRVGHACKVLLHSKKSVKEVYYQSGFNNFACFHKYFKQVTGKTPQLYQKEYFAA
jgi:AraC-like DNA-binding protein